MKESYSSCNCLKSEYEILLNSIISFFSIVEIFKLINELTIVINSSNFSNEKLFKSLSILNLIPCFLILWFSK